MSLASVKKMLSAGFTKDHFRTSTTSDTAFGKVVLMSGVAWLSVVVLFVMGSIALAQNASFIGAIDWLCALILVVLIKLIKIDKYIHLCLNSAVVMMYGLFLFLFIGGGISGTGFLWSYSLPLFTFFLLGTRKGLIVSSSYYIICFTVMIVDIKSSIINLYNIAFVVRFLASFAAVIFLSFFYERFREVSQEALLDAKKVAENASVAKSQFLANMSHEIRTPMNGVLRMNELLLATELTKEQQRLAENIQSSGELLLSVISNILDFSKIEVGKLTLECIFLDLQSLIEDVVAMQAAFAEAKGLTITIVMGEQTVTHLMGDPTRLRQVMINLVANAIKFTEKGDVVIRASTTIRDNGFVTLNVSVEDTGIGIKPDDRERLFKPFSQADGTTTRQYGGSGLGLAISSELVVCMGGALDCSSEPGKGSCFFFTVPFKVATEEEIEEQQPVSNTPSEILLKDGLQLHKHVLVAEDNTTNQEVAVGILRKTGCKITLVSNGREAVEAVSKHSYDLIFMDCQMPVMDGYQATIAIRRLEKQEGLARHTPVIALTANALEGDREKCLSSGMDDYISKPFKQDTIMRIFERWFKSDLTHTSTDTPTGKSRYQQAPERAVESVAKQAEPAIDKDVLNALRDLQMPGKPNILKRVITAYISSSDPLIFELKAAGKVKDPDSIQKAAHSLKSSSANVGALNLSQMCLELEMNCRNNTLENEETLIAGIDAEYAQVSAALKKEINLS